MITPTINLVSIECIDNITEIDKRSNLTPWSKFNYQESFSSNNQNIFGLFSNDALIGFCVISTVLDEAEILQIVIDLPYQKNGYGILLLTHIISHLDKNETIQTFLEVRVGNDNAIKLYEKSGFNIVGKRKNYYTIDGKKHDALLMARTNIANFTS